MAFFTELGQVMLKLVCKHKRPQIAEPVLRKRNSAGGIMFPDLRLYCKDTVIKTVPYWHENRHIDQWNKIESPEINPPCYSQLVHNTRGKNMQWVKDSIFYKWCREN